MWIKGVKFALPSHKSVLLGLVFVLLALTLSCGYIQTTSHSASADGIECSRSVFLTNYIPTKESGLFLSILFFSLIALALLIKDGLRSRRHLNVSPNPSLIFLKAAESIHKLYNPILEALRRGILHPQIYNLAIS